MFFRRPLPWLIAAALLAAAGGATVARMLAQKRVVLHSGTWLPQRLEVARFALSDLAGRRYDNLALAGHPSLLFFGYTSCPDVCPATLAVLAELNRQPPLPDLQIVFVSVDPERDQPAALRPYLASFDARFVGLAGSNAALAPLLRSLGVQAERVALPGGAYTIDHTATLYLLDRSGRMAAVFSPPFTATGLRADLEQIARRASL
jgi:protein SCO1/2